MPGVGGVTFIIHPQKKELKKKNSKQKKQIKKKRASFFLQKVFSFIFSVRA
jgi:hypothetical protein